MPKFQKEFPKNAAYYFDPASDEEFKRKHPWQYKLLVCCGIAALILPMLITLVITDILFPVPDSSFIILCIFGNMIMGIGLFNIVAAWLNQYLGHAVTFGCLLVGGLLTAAYYIIMYIPDIYGMFDESLVNYYLSSLFLLWIQPLFYALFRYSVDSWLEYRKIRKRVIQNAKKGMNNFWWYESIHQEYGIGLLYPINKLWTCLYLCYAVMTVLFGWVRFMIPVLCCLYVVCSILCALMTVFEEIQSNKDKYGVPVIWFRKEKGQRCDSIFQDAVGVIIPLIMGYYNIIMTLDIFSKL